MTIEDEKLKDLVRSALVDVLETRRDLMHDAVEEAIEDFASSRAVEQGISTEKISRQEIFAFLEGKK